jgi:opine dehydrogenase
MERGERWGQAENVTPAVGRVMEALDAERLAIAEAFGVSVRTIHEHYAYSYQLPVASIAEMNAELHSRGRGGFGPATLDSRYVLEDVPFGLLPTVLLGQLVARPATLHEAGMTMLSAAYGRDFAGDNDLLPALGFEQMTREELQARARGGY